MNTKLALNGLVFKGSGSPNDFAAAAESLLELKETAKKENADLTNIPDKPLSFTDAIKLLEKLGLLRPTQSLTPGAGSEPSTTELALSAAHHYEVKIYLCKYILN